MASKDEMKLKIVTFYQIHSDMFVEINVDAQKFWAWFQSFDTHEEYSKVFAFFFNKNGLEKYILDMKKIWNLLPGGREAWSALKSTVPGDRIVKLLRDSKSLTINKWKFRPKKKRKAE